MPSPGAGEDPGRPSRELLPVVFLQRHVLQLPDISQRVLKAASCIGLEFSFALLVQVLHPLPAADIYLALQRPLAEELIQRVQTAAAEPEVIKKAKKEDDDKKDDKKKDDKKKDDKKK